MESVGGGDFTSVNSQEGTLQQGARSLVQELSANITTGLQSKKVSEKIIAIKTILAVMSKGEDVAEFFPLVVQEITSEDETLRHLSYIYLIQYAEVKSDLSLMLVNSFDTSLRDPDPIVRTLSLKVLSSIRQHEIFGIVLEAVNKAASDMSPYVRKAAALALIKLYETQPKAYESFLPILRRLLDDQCIIPISGALFTLWRLANDHDEFIHPVFHKLCTILGRLDPWGQTLALRILTRYSRRCFKPPTTSEDWFSEVAGDVDPDLDLLLKSVAPLLYSITPSVCLEAAKLFVYVGPKIKLQNIVKPLIRLIYQDPSIAYPALSTIACVCTRSPDLFVPHLRHFFIAEDEADCVKLLKIKVMGELARQSNADILVKELTQHVVDSNKEIAAASVRAIGRTASVAGDSFIKCLSTIFRLPNSPVPLVASQALQMLCILLRPLPNKKGKSEVADPSGFVFDDDAESLNSYEGVDEQELIQYLLKLLTYFGTIDDPEAKSALISLVGDKANLIPKQAHEVLRQLALTFVHQPNDVKLQTINLAAKVFVVRPTESQDLVKYVFSLGAYDMDICIRDKSRFLHALLTNQRTGKVEIIDTIRKNFAETVMLPKKKPAVWTGETMGPEQIELGTFSQIENKLLSENSKMIDWAKPENIPPSSVRNEVPEEFQDLEKGEEEQKHENDIDDFFGPTSQEKEEEEENVQPLIDNDSIDGFFN